jgi:hydrogenase maturation protein HypF
VIAVETTFERLRVKLSGAVQGVGFRPFVYRLAAELELTGWVLNSSTGLVIEAEGPTEQLDRFLEKLDQEKPAPAVVLACEAIWLAPVGFTQFEIRSSDDGTEKTASVLPDLATCPACVAELDDPVNRRFSYPFTNCTHCGPRYTIIHDIPYDRPNTTMQEFALCPECRREYMDPLDRRFHAQPNACPVCGPTVWVEPDRKPLPDGRGSVQAVARALLRGEIVALKGIGGFQLLVDARNEEAVARLRLLKQREEKPFALMMPSLEMIREYCVVSPAEEKLLNSAATPIVLLRPNGKPGIASNVAKSSPVLFPSWPPAETGAMNQSPSATPRHERGWVRSPTCS